jgi:hypothetical protein
MCLHKRGRGVLLNLALTLVGPYTLFQLGIEHRAPFRAPHRIDIATCAIPSTCDTTGAGKEPRAIVGAGIEAIFLILTIEVELWIVVVGERALRSQASKSSQYVTILASE